MQYTRCWEPWNTMLKILYTYSPTICAYCIYIITIIYAQYRCSDAYYNRLHIVIKNIYNIKCINIYKNMCMIFYFVSFFYKQVHSCSSERRKWPFSVRINFPTLVVYFFALFCMWLIDLQAYNIV